MTNVKADLVSYLHSCVIVVVGTKMIPLPHLTMHQLQQVQSGDEMRELLDGDLFDLRCTCGITVPSRSLKFKDLAEIIHSFCLHFIIYSAKSELDQIKDGMGTLDVLSVMQRNPSQFLPLFLGNNRPTLTADELIGLLKVKEWSPEGSNSRQSEEAVIFNWENYVRETAGMVTQLDFLFKFNTILLAGGRQVHDCSPDEIFIHLPQILAFVTGADTIPPLGFPTCPVILFNNDTSRLLPVSSTCSLSLTLSLGLVEYEVFMKNMDMAVLNAYEFGQV